MLFDLLVLFDSISRKKFHLSLDIVVKPAQCYSRLFECRLLPAPTFDIIVAICNIILTSKN